MSKLTVAHLFDAVQTPQGLDGFQLHRTTSARDTSEVSRSSDESSPASLMDPGELSKALHAAFDPKRDRLLSSLVNWRSKPVAAGRPTRFDQGHVGKPGVALPESFALGSIDGDDYVKGGLATALGLAQARDCQAQEHWVVVVLDSAAVSASLTACEFDAVARTSRVLVVWADDGSGQAAGLSERVSAMTNLSQVGPLGRLDAESLIAVFTAIKALGEVALVHLRVRKTPTIERGRGKTKELRPPASPAMARVDKHARARPDYAANGDEVIHRIDPAHKTHSTISATLEVLRERAALDPRIVVVDLRSDRAFDAADCPFAEWLLQPPPLAGIAWYEGLSAGGCRPILLIDGLQRSRLELFLLHGAGQRRLPLTVVACEDLMGSAERDSAGHTWPGIRPTWSMLPAELPVMAPGTLADLDGMLDLAAAGTTSMMIVVPRQLSEAPRDVFARRSKVELGRGQCLCEGGDVTLLAWGATVQVARRAAFELARLGIEASVVNPMFLRPLDESLIAAVAERGRGTVIIEDASLPSDLMLGVLRVFSDGGRTLPFVRIALGGDACKESEESCVARIVDRCRGEFLPQPMARPSPSISRAPSARSVSPLPSAEAERLAVLDCDLSPDVMRWIDTYVAIGKRDLYLWRWARRGAELTTLPCVAPERVAHGCDTKVLSIMLCVLLDDIADLHGRGEFLNFLVNVVCNLRADDFASLPSDERRYAEAAYELAQEYERRIQNYPHYHEYQELLRYDAAQFSNTLQYSHLLNRNASYLNLAEHDLYLPHNMHMMSFATLDLMCTEGFPRQEIGKVREAAWHGQCMGRIGNLLSTWRRELVQKDLTSGIFARAVARGDLTLEQIAGGDAEQIEELLRGGMHEYYFVRRWQHHRDCMETALGSVRGLSLLSLLEGHDRFFQMHLGSQGLI
jgi:transketolase C-terminal domain/subunit